jgi:hypothetical protein
MYHLKTISTSEKLIHTIDHSNSLQQKDIGIRVKDTHGQISLSLAIKAKIPKERRKPHSIFRKCSNTSDRSQGGEWLIWVSRSPPHTGGSLPNIDPSEGVWVRWIPPHYHQQQVERMTCSSTSRNFKERFALPQRSRGEKCDRDSPVYGPDNSLQWVYNHPRRPLHPLYTPEDRCHTKTKLATDVYPTVDQQRPPGEVNVDSQTPTSKGGDIRWGQDRETQGHEGWGWDIGWGLGNSRTGTGEYEPRHMDQSYSETESIADSEDYYDFEYCYPDDSYFDPVSEKQPIEIDNVDNVTSSCEETTLAVDGDSTMRGAVATGIAVEAILLSTETSVLQANAVVDYVQPEPPVATVKENLPIAKCMEPQINDMPPSAEISLLEGLGIADRVAQVREGIPIMAPREYSTASQLQVFGDFADKIAVSEPIPGDEEGATISANLSDTKLRDNDMSDAEAVGLNDEAITVQRIEDNKPIPLFNHALLTYEQCILLSTILAEVNEHEESGANKRLYENAFSRPQGKKKKKSRGGGSVYWEDTGLPVLRKANH